MYEKEFARILDASKNNSLTFFVGAGVSTSSHAPSWKELINEISDKIGRPRQENYSYDDYLKIPQMFYNENPKEYVKTVRKCIDVKTLEPNKAHKAMMKLSPASFITTNYDTLLEDTALYFCQNYVTVACNEDVPNISGDRYILKMHGDFKNKNFVLREDDYLNFDNNFKLIDTMAKSIFSTNTVVFIGYGLTDYNIKLIINWAKELSSRSE